MYKILYFNNDILYKLRDEMEIFLNNLSKTTKIISITISHTDIFDNKIAANINYYIGTITLLE